MSYRALAIETGGTDSTPDTDSGTVKLSANLPQEIIDLLKGLKARRHVTITTILQRAVLLYGLIDEETSRGARLGFMDPKTGKFREVLWLP